MTLLNRLNVEQANKLYTEVLRQEDNTDALRQLCLHDLFFLLTVGMKRRDANKQWLYERCREVEANPNGYLDLWSREHYKSTVITFAKTIQDILFNPNITVGIFSHTRPIAKGFLSQIMREFETNEWLKSLFPEILYKDPRKEAPRWSLDNGIIVKRTQNPKESTVEAWGLVDGQPTSKHFSLLVYDDVVTRESVTTPEQIQKVTDAWALSLNLGAHGGNVRYIGTRYHFNDTYKTIMDREAATPRVHAATKDGTLDGEPVFLDRETNAKKRREMGPYVYSCHAKGTLITMADWSQKPIEEIKPGDMVVGFLTGGLDKYMKAELVPTKVLATKCRKAKAVRSILDNGDEMVHTPDHKWWTGRVAGKDNRKEYSELGFGKKQQKRLCQAIDITYLKHELSDNEKIAVGYLAGMIDGEGSVTSGTIHISQSFKVNAPICAKIEDCLNTLGFKYSVFKKDRDVKGEQRDYSILGGRSEKVRLLHLLRGWLAKHKRIEDSCYGDRDFGKGCAVILKEQTDVGEIDVYNIQTVSGNYIANGYCSKNCQMLQNPTADKAMGFKLEWLRYYDVLRNHSGWNFYILVDPASAKKKDSDYTVMSVIGLAPDNNYYLVDGIRDRLNLTERTKKLFELVRKWQPKNVGYERYGMQADIEHIQYVMEIENYRFKITELGGAMSKEDRIRRLVPIFEQGRFYLPHRLLFVDNERKAKDFVHDLINDEYLAFPVAVHDDMMDCLSRVVESDLGAVFPQLQDIKADSITREESFDRVQTEYDLFR